MSARTARQSRGQTFRAIIVTVLGAHIRILPDQDSWPQAPGRYGRLEWRGPEWDTGERRLYVFTPRRRVVCRLRAVPSVHVKQLGDSEGAFWIAADDVGAIQAVARILQLRRRRAAGTGRSAMELAAIRPTGEMRATSRPQEDRSTLPRGRESTQGWSAHPCPSKVSLM